MGKNIAIAGLVAVAVAGLGVGWFSFRRVAGLEKELAAMVAKREALTVQLADAEAGLDEVAGLRERVKDLEAAAVASAAPREEAGAEAKPEKDGNPFAKMMKGLSDDPAMKKMMAEQQHLMVDMTYGPLLENLDLTEEKEELRALLLERQVALMEQGLHLMDGSKSKDEKQALASALGERQKEWSSRIAEMIWDENYEKFDLYEKSQPEKFIEENNRLQENTYDRVAKILSPEQLESFRKSQESFRAMREFGMKMGVQMMGGKQEE